MVIKKRRTRKPKDPLLEADTIEELQSVEKHRLIIYLAKLFSHTVTFSFIAVVGLFLYLSIKNNQVPSLDNVTQLFGHFFTVLGTMFGM